MKGDVFCFKGIKYRVLEGKAGVKETYDSMADSYDWSGYLYWTRRIEEAEKRTIERWINDLSTPVLEVGCGTGRYAVEIAEGGSEVVALDISPRMLRKTMEKAEKRAVKESVNPVLADGEHLPFRNESFSGLTCALTFDHFENCGLAAQEFSRVLRREGLCILSTFNRYTLRAFKKRYNLSPDKIPFRTEDTPPTLIYEMGHSADEVRVLFTEHGLRILDVRGYCYWHLLPPFLIKLYSSKLDPILNLFKFILKHAEIHTVLMKK